MDKEARYNMLAPDADDLTIKIKIYGQRIRWVIDDLPEPPELPEQLNNSTQKEPHKENNNERR